MKYIAIINSDEPLTEGMIQDIKNTAFCGDDQNPYVFEIEKVLSMVEAHGLAKEAKQMAIKALEGKDTNVPTKWIPVSERLPEKKTEVLATTVWGDVTIATMYIANDWLIHEGATNAEADEILAWMPLPEPYRAESEGK